jgi:hypothetical protein
MRTFALCFTVLVVGCSGKSGDGRAAPPPTKNPPPNPCATPGARYLDTFSTISGDCGDIPAGIVNVADDGTIPDITGSSCQKVEQDGCRGHDTGCKIAQNGCTATVTTDVTFADDGSSSSGLETIEIQCNDGSGCSGSYQVSGVRR